MACFAKSISGWLEKPSGLTLYLAAMDAHKIVAKACRDRRAENFANSMAMCLAVRPASMISAARVGKPQCLAARLMAVMLTALASIGAT
jgi:hypothetical protein